MMFDKQISSLVALVLTASCAMSVSLSTHSLPTDTRHGRAQFSRFHGTSACGTTLPADQALVGIEGTLFDQLHPCGAKIVITAPNGHVQQATVQESCGAGCGANGLLLTTSLFQAFYSLDKGQFDATWYFVN